MSEQKRRSEAIQEAQRQFLRALSAGQVGAIDRFGNRITPGQKVLYRPPIDLIYEVIAVGPVLDLNVPVGVVQVTLSVTFPVNMQANQPLAAAIVIAMEDPHALKSSVDYSHAQKTDEHAAGAPSLQILRPDGDRSESTRDEENQASDTRTVDPKDSRSGVGERPDVSHLSGDTEPDPRD